MTTITNWGTAIISALANALGLLLAFVPRLIGFLIILLVGWLIAAAVSRAITFLLRKVGFDRLGDRIGLSRFEQRMGISLDAAGILGKLTYWFIFLIFLVPAADALGVPAVSNVLSSIVDFLPNVFVAILVLFLGTLLATVVGDLVRGVVASSRVSNPNILASIARYAIIGFAALIALEQLNIAPALLNELFGAIVAGAALAFGLAFGLGGRDAAKRLLDRTEGSVSSLSSSVSSSQQTAGSPPVRQPSQATEQRLGFPPADATRLKDVNNDPSKNQ
jgi:hypothetical protein